MNKRDEQDKRKIEEYKKNPMINFADSINRSMMGDLGNLTKGDCLTRIITTVTFIGILFFLSRCFINASTDDFEEKTGGLHQIKHFEILANSPSEAAVQLDLIHHSKQNIVPKVSILPDNKVYKGENLVNDDTLGKYIVELLFTDTRIQEKLANQLSTNNYKVTSNPDSLLQVVRIAYPPDDSQMIFYLGCTAKPQVNVNEENNKLLINLRG